jgi:hypothetical protein
VENTEKEMEVDYIEISQNFITFSFNPKVENSKHLLLLVDELGQPIKRALREALHSF